MPHPNADAQPSSALAAVSSRSVVGWCVAWTIAAAAVIYVSHDLSRLPLLADNQHYFFIAERAATGVPPHVSQLDPKNALGSLVPAGAIALGRVLGVSDLAAARAASIASAALCAGLVWLLAWRLTGNAWAAHLAAFAMATFEDFTLMAAMAGQPKCLLTLFVIVFLLTGFRRRPFVSGVACALAFLCWQPAMILLVAAAVPLLVERRRIAGLAALFAGFLAVNVVYEAYFWSHGALAAQIEQAYVFPARFMGGTWPPSPSGMLLHASWILRWRKGAATLGTLVPASFFVALALFWIAAATRGIGASLRALAGEGDDAVIATRRRGWCTLLVALHAVLPFVLWNYQGFPDRFLLLPFIAVGAGVLWSRGIALAERAPRLRMPIAAVAAVMLLVLLAGQLPRKQFSLDLPLQRRLASRVGAMLDAGDSVWAIGCTHLLAFNHANNFVRYGFFFRGMEAYLRRRHGGRELRLRPDGELPDVVLLSRARPERLDSLLARHYEAVPDAEFEQQYIRVFRRRQ